MINRVTLGTAAWNRTFVMGTGADDNIEIITTKTSGRAGGESLAKWNRTRRLCLSKIVTGNMLPVTDRKEQLGQQHILTLKQTTKPQHQHHHNLQSIDH